jgi:hypothetical protein
MNAFEQWLPLQLLIAFLLYEMIFCRLISCLKSSILTIVIVLGFPFAIDAFVYIPSVLVCYCQVYPRSEQRLMQPTYHYLKLNFIRGNGITFIDDGDRIVLNN